MGHGFNVFYLSTEFGLWSSENGEILSSVLSVSELLYLLSMWVEMKLLRTSFSDQSDSGLETLFCGQM